MNLVVEKHLTVIIATTVVGIATMVLALSAVRNAAAGMTASQFSWLIFLVPCFILLAMSFVIAVTASQIGRQLYVVVLGICLVIGVATMFVGSGWLSDESIAAVLLANSPEGTTITPILQSPMTILRDVAAFIVVPTVGLILGAWVGSRLHPLQGEKRQKAAKKK